MVNKRIIRLTAIILAAANSLGCWSSPESKVVVYSALDREFSEPILKDFESESGVTVLSKFDAESTKTVGLANAIIQEAKRPRCDLFWNNEILHTLRLEQRGLLRVYIPPVAAEYPTRYRSENGLWHGFAARCRVLIVNTDLVAQEDFPSSIHDLTNPNWKDQVAIAKPLFGTTATHAAVLFEFWGEEKAKEYYSAVRDNVRVVSGNKQVAKDVAAGKLAFGITDTDDAIIELEAGHPVKIIYPDQAEDQIGTLFIPNTLSVIKGSPNQKEATRLVDYLLQPETEKRLASGASAQFPLHQAVEETSRAQDIPTIKHMPVSFPAAARNWEKTADWLRQTFGR